MRPALIALLLVACEDTTPSYDASLNEPVTDSLATDCIVGTYGGDPTTSCAASWQCVMEGPRSIVCGSGIDPSGPACLCITEQGQTQVGVPTSCMDLAVLVDFGRMACGWELR